MKAESGKSFDPKVVEILANYYFERETSTVDGALAILPSSEISPIAAARHEVQHLFALAQDLGNSLSLDETLCGTFPTRNAIVPA